MRRIAFLFFVSVAILAYLRSPYSRLAEIEVTGLERLEKADVLRFAGVRVGDPVFVRPTAIRDRLLRSGEVTAADVRLRFPNRLSITVREARAVAREAGGALWLETGAMSRLGKRPADAVWLSDGLSTADKAALARALGALSPAVTRLISEIDREAAGDRLVVYLTTGDAVVVPPEAFAEEMAHLDAYLAAVPPGVHGRLYLLRGGAYFVAYGSEPKTPIKKDQETGKPASRGE
ncbi:MAG: FtsQ-type POTRA domain-containing protein [Hydrogenibacillus schlegelii]|uniref:FtsQ-type POTRA domain-containing protein n=1 Tax=Hydrogenibacillus schlegelii TaxID=1484 RepID=A0A947CUY2_HYDSH|nr:FtsQ-type POTRA domain-containing protein [Hydrogenibacillus schlegelii]